MPWIANGNKYFCYFLFRYFRTFSPRWRTKVELTGRLLTNFKTRSWVCARFKWHIIFHTMESSSAAWPGFFQWGGALLFSGVPTGHVFFNELRMCVGTTCQEPPYPPPPIATCMPLIIKSAHLLCIPSIQNLQWKKIEL